MTLTEAQEIISKVSYKNDLKITMFQSVSLPWVNFSFTFCVHNADQFKQKSPDIVPVTLASCIHQEEFNKISEYVFLGWIATQIDQFEKHERMEWLRYKGERLEDPHPEIPKSIRPAMSDSSLLTLFKI